MSQSRYRAEVAAYVTAMGKAGFTPVKVSYLRWSEGTGEDDMDTVRSEAEAIDLILSTEDSRLYFTMPSGAMGWVYFVLGNDPGEAVSDWAIPENGDEAEQLERLIYRVSDRFDPDVNPD